jgi:hypothetical protein
MQRPAATWRPIGTVLVDSGEITEDQLQAALAEQKTSGRRLGEILIDSGAITWNALAHAIAAQVEALDAPEQADALEVVEEPTPPPAPTALPPPPPITPPESAIPAVPKVDVHAGDRLHTVEAMLRDRQRAFLELVSTTETLRRAVAKLQDEVAEKDAEIARLRLQATA